MYKTQQSWPVTTVRTGYPLRKHVRYAHGAEHGACKRITDNQRGDINGTNGPRTGVSRGRIRRVHMKVAPRRCARCPSMVKHGRLHAQRGRHHFVCLRMPFTCAVVPYSQKMLEIRFSQTKTLCWLK